MFNLFKKPKKEKHVLKEVRSVKPSSGGWLEYKLNQEELDYVWKCVDEKSDNDFKKRLAGNLKTSRLLIDKDNYIYKNVLDPLINLYCEEFGNSINIVPVSGMFPLFMREWWVKYQYQHEFNPLHGHSGLYSFVIWLKIPTNHAEQNAENESNTKCKGSFSFQYLDMLGQQRTYWYNLNKEDEGTMLLFPSDLKHSVYPFYKCDDERVSISGNIYLDGFKRIDE